VCRIAAVSVISTINVELRGQVVARANAREHAVDNAHSHGARWDKRAHLRHDHDQRRLLKRRDVGDLK